MSERTKPFTTSEFFDTVLKELDIPNDLIDYASPLRYRGEDLPITEDEFSVTCRTEFGGNEGIYTTIHLEGRFRFEAEQEERQIGTFKSLRTDEEAMRQMAALGGSFVYKATNYVQNHSRDFIWGGYLMEGPSGWGYYTNTLERATERAKDGIEGVPYTITDMKTRKVIDTINGENRPARVRKEVEQYFKENLPQYRVMDVVQHPGKGNEYLYYVTGAPAKDEHHNPNGYAAWHYWNDSTKSLNSGHYCLDFNTTQSLLSDWKKEAAELSKGKAW